MRRDFCEDCAHDQVVPVLAGVASAGYGIHALLHAIETLFPAPDVRSLLDNAGHSVVPDAAGPVIAQICKTIIHPRTGKYSVARIFSGTLGPQTPLVNASRNGAALRPSGLFRLFGKRSDPVTSAGPGSIVAIGRLDDAFTGDTLSSAATSVIMPTVPPSAPRVRRRDQTAREAR